MPSRTVTFVFTGTERVFPVPAGVTSLHVVAVGGRGGSYVLPGIGATFSVTAEDPSVTISFERPALTATGVIAAAAVQGPKGDTGAQGRDAALPIVTCTTKRKKTTCTTTLAKLASGARVTLFRSGRAVATGRVARGGRVKLTAQRRLAAGTYALRAVRGSREQRVVVTVRRV